jgi:hypothetical protein
MRNRKDKPAPPRDPNASRVVPVEMLPYKPDSFTLEELQEAIRKVRANDKQIKNSLG